jgi:hypothetical protein
MEWDIPAKFVMPGLKGEARLRVGVPGNQVLLRLSNKDVDGRDRPGHDDK